MEQLVLVRLDAPGRYSAQSLAVPEVKAEAGSEAEAVEQVRQALTAWLANSKVVRIEVPESGSGNPWLDNLGWAALDPQFDDFQEELQRARTATDRASSRRCELME